MSNKKNIDRLFQEKFKDFEVAPNDALWGRINESLPNKKKKRRVIALWWQIGGVAAVIALLLTLGVSVFNADGINNQNLPVVNTDEINSENKQTEDGLETPQVYKQDKLSDNENLEFVDSDVQEPSHLKDQKNKASQEKTKSKSLTSPNKKLGHTIANKKHKKEDVSPSKKLKKLNTVISEDKNSKVAVNTETPHTLPVQAENTEIAAESKLKSVIENTLEDQKTASVYNAIPDKTEVEDSKIKNTEAISTDKNNLELIISEDSNKVSIQDAVAEQIEAIDEKEKEDEQNRWSIAPNVAPVYYGSLGQGSSLDKQFNENTKGSDINMSYGITGAYAVTKKLKIRAGINSVNLNQSTSNVFAFSGPGVASRGAQEAQPTGNISFNNNQKVLLMSSNMLGTSSAPEAFSARIAGAVDQRFGFIEVPLELEYRLLNKTLGVNVIGGFSTFFLNENEIYADIDGTTTLIGEANNINGTSFSANFGLGLDYSVSKQWHINLEPQFKYQINTFTNTTGDFRPFFIGVYTGLSFKF